MRSPTEAFSLALLLTLGFTAPSAAQAGATSLSALEVERLDALARVWGVAKFFHPVLGAAGAPDWDSALVATVEPVRRSRTTAEFGAAVQAMLSVLGDPLTRVNDTVASASATPERAFGWRFTADSLLVIVAGNYYDLFAPTALAQMGEARKAMARARGIVLDLRAPHPVDAYAQLQLEAAFAELERQVVAEPLTGVGRRRRVYYGYESSTPFSSGQYRTGTMVENGSRIAPTRGARAMPAVFLLDSRAALPPSALPLQAAGRALIVYAGDFGKHSIGETTAVPLGHGLVAQIRISDPVLADGSRAWLAPDAIVGIGRGGKDVALDSAMVLARGFTPSQIQRPRPPVVPTTTSENSYPERPYPSVEYRLLAAFRIWNVIEHFYPYPELLDTPWTDELGGAIRDFAAAGTEAEYGRAVARLSTRLADSHAYIAGPAYRAGVADEGFPPIRVRVIEGRPVVTAIFDTAAARVAGIAIGDEIESVDGVAAAERLRAVGQLISASTPHARLDLASFTFMNGPPGSRVQLGARDAHGRRKSVSIQRRREDFTTLYHRERTGPIVRILPGNVAYVDLDRLTLDMVDSMFTRIATTRAVIFDMRGYPTGTIWAIAPRLTDSTRRVARFGTPLRGHRSPAPSVETFYQTVEPDPSGQRYRGRVLMLMDERSVSQAEHTGLYLKATSGATFVGARTAGTDGEITTLALPGGLTMGFSGQAVMFPDGRQLQRVGLKPDVEIHPTVAGIRAGRDEVLDAAVKEALR